MGSRGPLPTGRTGRTRATGAIKLPPRTPTEVRRVHRILADELEAAPADGGLLLQLAEAVVIRRAAMDAMLADGLIDEDSRHGGALRRHPLMMVWKQAAEVAFAALRELGGSPLARLRLPEGEDAAQPANVLQAVEWMVAENDE